MSVRLTPDEAWDVLERAHTGILTTLRRDGMPISLPMWFVVLDRTICIGAPSGTKKLARLRHDPRASFLVESGERWAELEAVHLTGRIEVVDRRGGDRAHRRRPRREVRRVPHREHRDAAGDPQPLRRAHVPATACPTTASCRGTTGSSASRERASPRRRRRRDPHDHHRPARGEERAHQSDARSSCASCSRSRSTTPQVRVIVITAVDPVFTAGVDFKEVAQADAAPANSARPAVLRTTPGARCAR